MLHAKDQLALLQNDDPKLARNKKHVFDFWRIVYEGGHMDRVAEFMTPEYIEHNPNVPSGRDWFVRTIGSTRKPRPVAEQILVPVIAITAEKDIVTVMWARKVRDREEAGRDLPDDLVRRVPHRREERADRRALGFVGAVGKCWDAPRARSSFPIRLRQ